MSLCQGLKKTYSMCNVWFVNGTPWTKSPHNLLGVFFVLNVPFVWDLHSIFYLATLTHYLKLISEYKSRFAKIDEVSARALDAKMIDQIAGILEKLMICYIGESM